MPDYLPGAALTGTAAAHCTAPPLGSVIHATRSRPTVSTSKSCGRLITVAPRATSRSNAASTSSVQTTISARSGPASTSRPCKVFAAGDARHQAVEAGFDMLWETCTRCAERLNEPEFRRVEAHGLFDIPHVGGDLRTTKHILITFLLS